MHIALILRKRHGFVMLSLRVSSLTFGRRGNAGGLFYSAGIGRANVCDKVRVFRIPAILNERLCCGAEKHILCMPFLGRFLP